MSRLPNIDWNLGTSLATLLAPLFLGGVATYLQIEYNTALTQRELLLTTSLQFISSLWFGWVISFIFSERQFQEKQRKFAISAFRRIQEIEGATNRILARVRVESASASKTPELEIIREMTVGLQATVKSSKADWGDVIGEEIKTLEEIAAVEQSAETPNETTTKRLEGLLAKLPPALEISTRQTIDSAQKMHKAIADFESELREKGYIRLRGFWDETFEKDVLEIPLNTTLTIKVDDVASRVGALIAHTAEGQTVGVITNSTAECTYPEFSWALIRVIGRSQFDVVCIEQDKAPKFNGHTKRERERHYFTCRLPLENAREDRASAIRRRLKPES